ncbi:MULTISPECIES: hypothetical protein [Polymorphospora]|uniref:BON domain-containing protein n=1 Tax=Polymorphospora lycopeni TaxID=3140240 RepID=A0ABV5CJQ6_9ACTN
MQLSAVSLAPVGEDRTPLTPETLRDLVLGLRAETDRVEHVKVIERAGMMWIAAFVAVADDERAQHCLHELCARLTGVINGWDIVGAPEWHTPAVDG